MYRAILHSNSRQQPYQAGTEVTSQVLDDLGSEFRRTCRPWIKSITAEGGKDLTRTTHVRSADLTLVDYIECGRRDRVRDRIKPVGRMSGVR